MLRINDPLVLKVRVQESNEKLVNILTFGNFKSWSQISNANHQRHLEDFENPLIRTGVANRISKAFKKLPPSWGLFLCEAFRSYSTQKKLYNYHLKKLQRINPTYNSIQLEKAVSIFISNPDVYSPHLTGGALDVGLVNEKGLLVDVGNYFEYTDSAHTHYPKLTLQQKLHRLLLIKAMTSAGFVNYPYEWWHWSYGDKYWAYLKGKTARYGEIKYLTSE